MTKATSQRLAALERVMGLEPTTASLGSWCSTN